MQIFSSAIERDTPGNDSQLMLDKGHPRLLLDEGDPRFLLDEGKLPIRLLLDESWIDLSSAWVKLMVNVHLMVRVMKVVVKLCANLIRRV